jgi:hypothetical protein|tara:strand:+ start:2688 stop:3059 length:372 start_codon:yes stop_codon:yes gene_type:complete
MGVIENLATIIIVFSLIKIVMLLINPQSWMNFAKNIYKNPTMTSWISFILAAVVLYYLVNAGITIVQIFAVLLFLALFMVGGMAKHGTKLIKEFKMKTMWKDYWLYTLLWALLLIWGIKELFF